MIPEKIGRYQIEAKLGQGGMATVYRAQDPHFGRNVAIKVLPHEFLDDATMRGRFEREARTIASLEHPAIVSVYDFGEHDGQPYLVMRLMPNGSLADRLQRGPIPLAESGRILQRILSALEAAHTAGIIHRDLKPANILFDQYNEAYLSDFGLARPSAGIDHTTLTKMGSSMGTPGYMSPEQIEGQELDPRTDLYAIGVIAFELLTGRRPYEADTATMVIVKQMTELPPPLAAVNPDLPPAYEDIIARTITRTPQERVGSAADLADLCERALAATAASPSPPTRPAQHPSAPTPTHQPYYTAVETGQHTVAMPSLPPTPPPVAARPWVKWLVGGVAVIGLVLLSWFLFGRGEETAAITTPSPAATTQTTTSTTNTAGSSAAAEAEARASFDRGDLEAAVAQADACLAADPNRASCYQLRGYLHYLRGEAELALNDLNQAVTLNPRDLYSYETQGYVYLFLYDGPAEALTAFEQALAIDPTRAQAHANVCAAHNNLGQNEQALAACQQCQTLDPNLALCYEMVAYTYRHMGDEAAAEQNWRKATELDPNNSYPFMELAWIGIWNGNYEQALVDINRALELDPERGAFYYARATLHAEAGDVASAVNEFHQYASRTTRDDCPDCWRQMEFYMASIGHPNNVALGRPITVPSERAGLGEAAVDGNFNQGWGVGLEGAGNSTADPTQPLTGWLELDLEEVYELTSLHLRNWQNGTSSTTHWVYGRATAAEPYQLLTTLEGEMGWGTWLAAENEGEWPAMRYLRIETLSLGDWGGWLEIAAVAE